MHSPEQATDFVELVENVQNLAGNGDPTTRALANKAVLQASVLGMYEYEEVFSTNMPLDIGVFRVFPTVAEVDWATESGEFSIKKGQTYLDYHVPRPGSLSNDTANNDYREVAKFMHSKPEITSIVGLTYRIMSKSAVHNQGFNTEQITLPKEVMRLASAMWSSLVPDVKPKHFQTAHLVWHNRDTFLERFLD